MLEGKTALVTGAAKRVGRATALLLAQEGVNLVFNYRSSAAQAAETADRLRSEGVQVLSMQADLTSLEQCDRLLEEALDHFGQIDILVNNASDFSRTELAELSRDRQQFSDSFDRQVQIHMRAPLYLGMKLGLQMKENGWGRIVNLTDRLVVKGQSYRNWVLYIVTKYGLYGITQVLAEELRPEVTVNSVAPGLVMAPEGFSPEQVEKIRNNVPLRREAGPDEIALDVLHLIKSEFKTGAAILTDGGSSLSAK
ncbi:MAG: SDR family NAD(P)-dependent oxidoreductase [Acidobacteriota bacterium]